MEFNALRFLSLKHLTTVLAAFYLIDVNSKVNSEQFNDTHELDVLQQQYRLFAHLLNASRYNPRCDPTALRAINVSFYLELHQLLTLDENTQTIRLFMWIQQDWRDPQLYWRPKDYGGIVNIALPYTDVWKPEIFLTNSVEMDKATTESPMLVYLTVNPEDEDRRAAMMFGYNAIFKFSCPINMRMFPFDIQTCTMIFEPFLDKSRIVYSLLMNEVDIDYYRPNQEWTLVSRRVLVNDSFYVTAEIPFSRITATFHLRRRPLYYVVGLILPTMLISFFASIGLFIPVDTPECKYDKLSLGMTALLTFSIQLLQVSSQVPKGTSSVPLLSWIFLSMMTQITISTLVAVWLCEPKSCEKVKKCMSVLKWFVTGCQTRPRSPHHHHRLAGNVGQLSTKKSRANIFFLNTNSSSRKVTPAPTNRVYARMKETDFSAHTICMMISVSTMVALMGGIFLMACFSSPDES